MSPLFISPLISFMSALSSNKTPGLNVTELTSLQKRTLSNMNRFQ